VTRRTNDFMNQMIMPKLKPPYNLHMIRRINARDLSWCYSASQWSRTSCTLSDVSLYIVCRDIWGQSNPCLIFSAQKTNSPLDR